VKPAGDRWTKQVDSLNIRVCSEDVRQSFQFGKHIWFHTRTGENTPKNVERSRFKCSRFNVQGSRFKCSRFKCSRFNVQMFNVHHYHIWFQARTRENTPSSQRSTFQPSTFNIPTFNLQRSNVQPLTFIIITGFIRAGTGNITSARW